MLVTIAVPVPTLDLLTYAVPASMPTPPVGGRVVVPVGGRSLTGIVVAVGVSSSGLNGREARELKSVLDTEPFIPADVVGLAQWTAEYYGAGAGETITAVLPPKTRDERADAHKTQRVAQITAAGMGALDAAAAGPAEAGHYATETRPAEAGHYGTGERAKGGLTAKQHEALTQVGGVADGVATATLAAKGISSDMLTRLSRAGLIVFRQERVERDPFESSAMTVDAVAAITLTDEQRAAVTRLEKLAALGQFKTALLHGVTGSGKTEVYLRISAAVRASGRRVLALVPEIALTPAVAAAFRGAFGERVAIQHSAMSDGERHDQWQRIRRGEIDVVVGTRSAIFAPLPNIGLIIVDEEHDASYKQDESPRYNGRDVAIVRGQRSNALVVLGSATPSMESYANAMNGRYERVVLERRVQDRPLAAVQVVDMREEYASEGPDVILSRPLRAAIEVRLQRGEQSLILLNRRGFATAVFCRQCAGTIDCQNCSVSLVVHGEGAARRARCHYCNFSARVPSKCPSCAAPYMEQTGFGTERVEAEVLKAAPGARVARLDRDSVRRKGAMAEMLTKFRRGEVDVMVGTQMIAKGHDFPLVTLVGVVSADIGLGMADFRASERTFQILTQVVGRAGRGERPGEALVQTLYPDHYAIQLARKQDYPAFFEREMLFRTAMRYPPQVSLINAVIRARTYVQAMDDAVRVVDELRQSTAKMPDVRVLGPAPAPLGKLRGEFRVQFLMKGTNRKRLREALQAVLVKRPELTRRTTVDIDPLSVL